jgi:hypothetical protein
MAANKTQADVTASLADPLASATRMQSVALEGAGRMGTAALEAYGTTLNEMTDFVTRRLQRDLSTQQALMSCRTFADVQEVQSKAMRDAMDDYRAEGERLAEIARDLMATASDTAREAAATAANGPESAAASNKSTPAQARKTNRAS